MTFTISALSVDASQPYQGDSTPVIVEPVALDRAKAPRAGNIAALRRYPGMPTNGRAFHLLLDEDGYQSSNAFFEYEVGADDPAFVSIPDRLRSPFESVLRDLLELSPTHQLVLVFEDNGHVTDTDLTPDEIRTIECLGPITLADFWAAVDRQTMYEDSVVVVRSPRSCSGDEARFRAHLASGHGITIKSALNER